jgi:hypothetical protein
MRSSRPSTTVLLILALTGAGCGANSQRSAAPGAAGPQVRATVSPQQGARHTPFAVSITTRVATGVFGRTRRSYSTEARAVNSTSGCVTHRDRTFPSGAAARNMRATLDPRRGEGGELGWCRGLFRGTITYSEAFACPASGTCRPPQGFPDRAETVARFTFRVRG